MVCDTKNSRRAVLMIRRRSLGVYYLVSLDLQTRTSASGRIPSPKLQGEERKRNKQRTLLSLIIPVYISAKCPHFL